MALQLIWGHDLPLARASKQLSFYKVRFQSHTQSPNKQNGASLKTYPEWVALPAASINKILNHNHISHTTNREKHTNWEWQNSKWLTFTS
jgi:hypothetical protein